MAKATTNNIPLDSCITCSSKYNRIRPSLCQCKHCSNSFCFDCMKEHNDELQENIVFVSNHRNELKLLINSQRKFIKDETIRSKEQISQWLRKYIDNLNTEKARIDRDIDNAEKEGQKIIDDIEAKLQILSPELESFTKTNAFEATRMKELSKQIEELTRRTSSVTVTREYDLPSTMPKYKFKFEESSQPIKKDVAQAGAATEPKNEEADEADIFSPELDCTWEPDSTESTTDEEVISDPQTHEVTSYVIHCMASDGINVMYSTIENPQHDLIVYCYLDVSHNNYGLADPCRPWMLQRIVDMIWWTSVNKFVCGTANGICTVEYMNGHFKIVTVIRNRWTDVRIAANTNSLWVHEDGKIMIYDVNFKLTRAFDFQIPSVVMRTSFCVTNNIVAFLVTRADQINLNILQIQFFDYNLVKLRSFDLGSMKAPCMVRSHGTDRFFIAAGKHEFLSMTSRGRKRTIHLHDQADRLAVLNNQRLVLTKLRAELELAEW